MITPYEAVLKVRSLFIARQSLESRFISGVFWAIAGALIAQGLGMISAVMAARLLGREGYGEFGIVNSTLGTFGIFAGLGLGLTATKNIAEHRTADPSRAGRILGLTIQVAVLSGGVLAIALYILAPLLASRILNAPFLANELRMGCLLLFVNAINGTQTGALAGLEAFRASAIVNCLRGMLNFPLVVAGALWFGVAGAVGATVVVGLAAWILNGAALQHECKKNGILIAYRESWPEMRVLWAFSIPAFLSNIAVATTLWVADAILANQPSGYGQLGLFNAADQWRTVLMFLPSAFVQVALPLMSKAFGAGDTRNGYGKSMLMTQGLSIAVVMPAGAGLMFLSDWIARLFGNGFYDAGLVVIGVVAGVMIQSVVAATGPAIQATGRMWLGFGVNMLWGTVFTTFVWFAAPSWGAVGVGFAFVISYLLLAIVSFAYLAPTLPDKMASRAFLTIGYVLFLTAFCVVLPSRGRLAVALPCILVTMYLTYWVFLDGGLRQASTNRFRSFWLTSK